MNKYLSECALLKQAHLPKDLNGAATVGERIAVAKSDRIAIVVAMGDSVGAVANFSLKQHTLEAAGVSKDLEVKGNYYYKAGAAKSFTKVEVETAAAAYDLSAIFAADEGVVVFEILGEDLDVDGDFAFVSIEIADATAAKLASTMYVGHDAKRQPAYSEEV